MLLGNLVKSIDKKYHKISISGISFDSRKVKKRNIFFAINGQKTSGNKFIGEAILKGAAAIISDKKIKPNNFKIPIMQVDDCRKVLSEASSKFYKKKPNNIIAVTGTNGKSSVADFFYQILKLNKIEVASIGTLGVISRKYKKITNLTSVDPLYLHKTLKLLAKNGVNNVIIEASSHGLKQKRLDNLNFKIGIFTNLSRDHLDYHKNMNSYFNAKMHLLKNLLNSKSKIITDEDNKQFNFIKNNINKKLITIGSKSGTIKILDNHYNENKQIIKIFMNSKIYNLEIPLIGYFQIKNLLMAILAAINSGLSKNKIFNKIHKIKSVPGRLEHVLTLKNNSYIIIDFAHTPDALEQSLVSLKKQFKKDIILVFGCGGDRDKKKRFLMGKVAKKYCRKVFVTDDNPRSENPKKIREAIIKGCKEKAVNISNRKKAIKNAINDLRENEILLVSGKGHETTQIYGKRIINFSDKQVIKNLAKNKHNNFNNIKYRNVSINSKNIKKNDIFFAIKGKKNDGHNFVKEVIKKGAIKCVVNKKLKKIPNNKIIVVKDSFNSLNNLAKINRENTKAQIIGITGSSGKTTLKNLIGFTLNKFGKTHLSPHSYNNKFGVPLSIANIKKDTKYGIFEIGMDKKGEINELSKIVKPKVAVITNIAGAHFKNFKTLKDIAKAKAEIINNILNDGTLVLNKADKFFSFLSGLAKKKGINVISFSNKKKADIFLSKIIKTKKFYRLKIKVKKNFFFFNIKYINNNVLNNILANVAVMNILNLDLKTAEKYFINFKTPEGRGDINVIKKFKKKFIFIDESYNANPLSMHLAIRNIHNYKIKGDSKKLVFLGDMLELGKKSKKFHKELSTVINKSDIDKVYVYGKYIKKTFSFLRKNKKGKMFDNLKDAYNYFRKIINNNDLLMVKGSNATGLNKFSKILKKD